MRTGRPCHALGVSRSGYYAWAGRAPPPRAIRQAWLTDLIGTIHQTSRGTYGAPRVHAELVYGHGITVGHNTVSLLMRRAGLAGLPARSRGKRAKKLVTVTELVRRDFRRTGPNQLWVTDITEHPTREGKVYCCVVLDAWSRRVVGWAIDSTQRADLATNALGMAIDSRAPAAGGIIHGDHGTQFTSWTFTERARRAGLLPSLGTIGDPYDKTLVSHCTSGCCCGENSLGEFAALAFDEPGVAGVGWVEQGDVLVVGLVGGEQAGAAPGLDGGDVDAETVGDLGEGEQALGAEPGGVAGQVVAAA
jgi:hypothetical protein